MREGMGPRDALRLAALDKVLRSAPPSPPPLQPRTWRYAFDMPKLPPTTIDAETLKLLLEAKTALKTSQAEVLRQCIRAEAPLMIARQRAQATFDAGLTALQSLKFDKKLVKLAKEARRGDR